MMNVNPNSIPGNGNNCTVLLAPDLISWNTGHQKQFFVVRDIAHKEEAILLIKILGTIGKFFVVRPVTDQNTRDHQQLFYQAKFFKKTSRLLFDFN